MDPEITFEFEGQMYTVEAKAFELGRIILPDPDGRLLEANKWIESYPAQPEGLHNVPHLFEGLDAEAIAHLLNGVVAKKV